MNSTSRIVVLVDMDCFYCQVEEKLNPMLKGKPMAVVQYNEWRGGGIIAVNYEARAKGVTRHMRGNDARAVCPDINLVKVPQIRGKADLNKYRNAGKQVAEVLQTFTPLLERASVDEAYLDITEAVRKRMDENKCTITFDQVKNTFVVGCETQDFVNSLEEIKYYDESKFRLAVGGVITEEIRAEVYKVTGYRCSAGVAHNKILAKLVCGLHKPNKQTILPQDAVPLLYEDLPVKKIKGFGGKFGEEMSQILNIKNMGELRKFSEKELAKHFDEKSANWLYNIARGEDDEPVTVRLISKSIGCSKNFLGKNALVSQESVEHWLEELVSELSERLESDLEENNRKAKSMIINFSQVVDGKYVSASRTCQINSYKQQKLITKAMDVLKKNCRKSDGTYKITHLGFSIGNFEDIKNVRSIATFFKNMTNTKTTTPKKVAENISPELDRGFCDTQTKLGQLSDNLTPSDQAKLLESSTFLESDSESSNDENSSIFSTATIPDRTSPNESIVYLETVRPESVLDQNLPEYENKANFSSSSVDSIDPEICKYKQPNDDKHRPPSSSFFAKYFSDSDTKRDFDTSKMLPEEPSETDPAHVEDISTEDKEMEISVRSEEKIDINNDFCGTSPMKKYNSPQRKSQINKNDRFLQTNFVNTESINKKEICTECGKPIPSEELMSHMDYHFAIKMIKSEAHLYQTPTANISKNKSPVKKCVKEAKTSNKPTKRKSNEATQVVAPISAFFKKENNESMSLEDSEMCTQCNKRIKIEDFPSHLDYHEAKKLHLELNSKPSTESTLSSIGMKVNEKTNKYKTKSKPKKSEAKISLFFNKKS